MSLIKHILVNCEEETSNTLAKWICENCNRQYKSKSARNLHLRVECGKEPQLKCSYCCKMFYHNGNYKRHLKFVHNFTV